MNYRTKLMTRNFGITKYGQTNETMVTYAAELKTNKVLKYVNVEVVLVKNVNFLDVNEREIL